MKKFKAIFFNEYFLFLILFIVFASFYYDSVLDKPPMNDHLWRQTDCIAFAQNYAKGNSFIEPEINILLADKYTSGKTAGEFPILYYSVGKFWALFGQSFLSFRIFYLIILFFGSFAFFASLKHIFKNNFWAFSITLLLLTSPLYIIYSVSFLTDAPAFSFVLIALYFLLMYKIKDKQYLFALSMMFFSLAGLLKVSSLIAFVVLFAVLILETLFKNKIKTTRLFKSNYKEFIGFVSVIAIVFIWYYFASYYNSLHRFKYTFNAIYTMKDAANLNYPVFIEGLKNFTSPIFFSKPVLYLLLFVSVFNLSLFKKLPLFVYISTVLSIIGSIMYFILWLPLFGNHDYYFTPFLILFPAILLPFLWYVKTFYYDIFVSKKLKFISLAFLLFNFIYCFNVVKLKTLKDDGEFLMISNHSLVQLNRWTNWNVKVNVWRYYEMQDYLRDIGINEEDKVISIDDPSFSTTLVLMNRKGWTNYMKIQTSKDIENLKSKGAKYLFVHEPESFEKEFLLPFYPNQVGDFKGIKIYRL